MNWIWNYLLGRVFFSLQGEKTEQFLNICAQIHLPVEQVFLKENCLHACVSARYYQKVCLTAKQNHLEIHMIKKNGVCFWIWPLRHRYGIWCGLLTAFIICIFMKNYIWHIDYYHIPIEKQTVLAQTLYEMGIYEGVRYDNQTLELAKQKTLLKLPEYSWMSFNFMRGRLVVEAQETIHKPDIVKINCSDLIAGWDGIIQTMEIYSGYSVKQVGQSVQKGEKLVSGIGKDWQNILHYQKSRGKVIAFVPCEFSFFQPYQIKEMTPLCVQKEYTDLLLNQWRIPLHQKFHTEEMDYLQTTQRPVQFFGFSFPALWSQTQVIRQTEREIFLSKRQAEQRAISVLHDMVYTELVNPKILTREIISEEQENGVFVTMKIKAYVDIAREMPVENWMI